MRAKEGENPGGGRLNTLNPGGTRTPRRRWAFRAEAPDPRRTPADIMPTYLWLMGPDSRGHTGEMFDAQPPKA